MHCAASRDPVIRFEPRVRMRLPAVWHGSAKVMYAFREDYEPELIWIRSQLRPGMICVDGGAAFGIWTLTMARLVGADGHVIAFEPSRQVFKVLEENVRRNGFENVTLVRKALSNRRTVAPLYHTRQAPGAFSLEPEGGEASETVETVPLDEALSETGGSDPHVMKLDLEGAEGDTLSHMEPTLRRRPVPIVVYEQPWLYGARPGVDLALAWKTLAGLGYHQYQLGRRGAPAPRLDAPVEGGNVVAVHGGPKTLVY